MKASREQQKAKALETMDKLGFAKSYVYRFKNWDSVICFEKDKNFPLDSVPFLVDEVEHIEQKYGVLVYAVTHWQTTIHNQNLDLWAMLVIPSELADFDDIIYEANNNEFHIYAYCFNATAPYCSEFGEIGVNCSNGGIARIF